jgi:hypothetical protein
VHSDDSEIVVESHRVSLPTENYRVVILVIFHLYSIELLLEL